MRTMTDQNIKNVYVDRLAHSPGNEFPTTPECLCTSALSRRLFEAAFKVIKRGRNLGGLGVDCDPAQFEGEEAEDVQDYLDHLETSFGGRELMYIPAPGSQAYVAVYGDGRTLGVSSTVGPAGEGPSSPRTGTARAPLRQTEHTPITLSGRMIEPEQVHAEVYRSCLTYLITAVSDGE